MRYVGPRHVVIDDQPAPVEFWPPDQSFAGLTVAIIGGGPSLAMLDIGLLRGHRFIAINSGARAVAGIATAADPLYFTDNNWHLNRPQIAAAWPGPVVTSNRHAKARIGAAARYIDVIALTEWIGARPDYVQASSGHIAACLAARLGARRVVLVAFEARAVDGRTHGHGDYTQHDVGVYAERFLPGWRGIAGPLAGHGVEVVNATPGSAITDFPFMPLAEAFAR